MKMNGFIAESEELRKLILEHPDYPIAVLAGEDANSNGEYSWQFCSELECGVGRYLDVKTPFDRKNGILFADEDDFENVIAEVFYQNQQYKDLPDDEFDRLVKAEAAKYASDWKDVIFIYADNP